MCTRDANTPPSAWPDIHPNVMAVPSRPIAAARSFEVVHSATIVDEVVIVCFTNPTTTREKSKSGTEFANPTIVYESAAPANDKMSTPRRERRPRSETTARRTPPTICDAEYTDLDVHCVTLTVSCTACQHEIGKRKISPVANPTQQCQRLRTLSTCYMGIKSAKNYHAAVVRYGTYLMYPIVAVSTPSSAIRCGRSGTTIATANKSMNIASASRFSFLVRCAHVVACGKEEAAARVSVAEMPAALRPAVVFFLGITPTNETMVEWCSSTYVRGLRRSCLTFNIKMAIGQATPSLLTTHTSITLTLD